MLIRSLLKWQSLIMQKKKKKVDEYKSKWTKTFSFLQMLHLRFSFWVFFLNFILFNLQVI